MATLPDPEDGTGTVEPRRWERWRGRARRLRPLTRISLATRIAIVALLVTLISLVVTGAVGLVRGNDLADGLGEDRVVTIAASQADAVELYFGGIGRDVAALATSPGTRDAIERLGDAYVELSTEPVDATLESELTQFYLSDVVPTLEAVRGTAVGASLVAPDGAAAVYLQNAYVIPRTDDNGVTVDPSLVVDAGDGSNYSAVHAEVHQTFGQIALRSGFDDLFLIDARRDLIVYSARKQIDFATSLQLGPLSGSAFARLIGVAALDESPTGYSIADFSSYPPAADRPMSFVASAVTDGDGIVGYVAAAITTAPVDSVLSGGGTWPGFDEVGGSYLVGADGLMRSTARGYQETPSGFLAESSEPGPGHLTDEQRRRIAATGTTALVQGVNRNVFSLAMQGAGTVQAPDFRGVSSLTAYRPVDVAGPGWMIFTEIPTDRLDEPIEQYARNMLLAIALFVVAVTFVAVRWSNRLMAPIRSIAARLRAVRSSSMEERAPMSERAVPANSPVEYDELASNIDQMLDRLQDRQRAVVVRAQERTRLLRQFLPAGVARRTEEADGEVVDHVGNASVVAVMLDGVEQFSQQRGEVEMRAMLNDLVDEADALAAELGLERVKITGGTYIAVCGVARPYLDHAPRAVAFALGVRDLTAELTGDAITVSAGVEDGAISVGLAGRTGLVYDAWGSAVADAERMASSAPAGTVAVSPVVRRQLPSDFLVAESAADADQPSVVTGRLDATVSP